MSSVFIAGGAGFIGSHVVEDLTAHGHEVIVYDSFSFYFPPEQVRYYRYIAARQQLLAQRATVLRGDARNKDELRRVLVTYKPDIIVTLAALPIADLSTTHSEEAVAGSISATVNLLETIRDLDSIQRFVYVSSSMVYGDFEYVPADEDHPKRPKDVYGGVKYAGEVLTEAFGRRFEIPYAIVRPSACYGPTDVNLRVSQIFVESALEGRELVLKGGGAALDFTYVKDTAQGIALVATHPKAHGEVFNITRGEGRTLTELADTVANLIPGVNTRLEPFESHRPLRGALDISKAKRLLGYEPRYSLEDGIAEYIEFVRESGVIQASAS